MKNGGIQPFHRDDLKRFRELTYLRASTEAYFLLGAKGWKFDHTTFRLTPVLLDGSEGPVAELGELYVHFLQRRFTCRLQSSERAHSKIRVHDRVPSHQRSHDNPAGSAQAMSRGQGKLTAREQK
jgi:hypothetical protein